MKILIVDDETDARTILHHMLSSAGYDVKTAGNGMEALETMKTFRPEMIVSDILMPEMDGFQLCRKIRENKEFDDIIFVFYSGTYTDEKDEELAIRAGGDWFIRKPQERKPFLDAINGIIRSAMDGNGIRHGDTALDETEFLKLYSQGLVRKVEKKSHEMKSAIEESEKKYRDLFESSPDGIVISTLEGRILEANQGFFDMFGYDPSDISNLKTVDLYIDKETREKLLAEVAQKGAVKNIESRRRKKDGSEIVCISSVVAKPVGENGEIVLQSILRDVTELRNLEQKYHHAQKMESIGNLAGGVAHDFNNMLSIIIGYSELCLDDIRPDDPLRQNIEEILIAARRSEKLVRQLLAFARKQMIKPKIVNINDHILSCTRMLKRLIGEDISFSFKSAPDLWNVKIDPVQIDQILTNLVINARDAINGVGSILIETGNILLDEEFCRKHTDCEPGEYAMVSVTDTGCGIPENIIEKIFDPFFTTKGKEKGSGLGLSTTYGIVRQNDGFITVENRPEKGVIFRIGFPKSEGEVEEKEKPDLTPPVSGAETILIVEDEEIVLKFFKTTLTRKGYKVLGAKSPKEAIHLCQTFPGKIDLLISDVVMPTMNGQVLKGKIREMRPDIRVLFMSGYTADIIQHRGVPVKDFGFIQKPFSPKAFLEKIREMLGS